MGGTGGSHGHQGLQEDLVVEEDEAVGGRREDHHNLLGDGGQGPPGGRGPCLGGGPHLQPGQGLESDQSQTQLKSHSLIQLSDYCFPEPVNP